MEDGEIVTASFMTNEANVGGLFECQIIASTRATRVEKSHPNGVLQRAVQVAQDGTDQLRFRLVAEALRPFYTERTLDDVQRTLLSALSAVISRPCRAPTVWTWRAHSRCAYVEPPFPARAIGREL